MRKFLLRLLINIFKFLCISVPLQLLGALILLPFLYYRHDKYARTLPSWLKWFDCADFYVGRDTSTYVNKIIPQGWWIRYCWLAWRNPINYFSYKYLGFLLEPPYKSLTYIKIPESEHDIGDSSQDIEGFYYQEIEVNSKVYYEYYYIYVYTIPFTSIQKCIRFRMGWKLGQNIYAKYGHVQDVFVISPFHTFSGIKG